MIILTILKWIGIVLGWFLLGILALALLILLLVLFVPFRYSASISNHESDEGGVDYGFGITWILHAITVRKRIDSDVIVIKILGIPIKKIGPDKGETGSDVYEDEDEDIFSEPEMIYEDDSETVDDMVRTAEESEQTDEMRTEPLEAEAAKDDVISLSETQDETRKRRRKRRKGETEPTPEKHKEGPVEHIFSLIRDKIEGIKQKIRATFKKIGFIFYKLSSIIDIVKDKTSRRTVKRLVKEVIRMIRYVGPKKIKGTLRFGTGDPSSTGLILAGVSMCKLAYRKDVSITPDFEEKCLVGDAFVKGRIRVVYFVRMALRIWFDKDVHRLWKNYRRMKKNIKRKERALRKEGVLQN